MALARYVKVPWFNTPRWNETEDLTAQGDPETAVFLHASTLVGLHIKGVEGHQMLGIKEDAEGHPVSCAMTDEIHIDTMAVVPAHSNPRRHLEDENRYHDHGEA